MIPLDIIQLFKSKINAANSISIIPHLNPDGDAIGSSLGLCHTLQNLGKETKVVMPNAIPKFLSWMKGAEELIDFEHDGQLALATVKQSDLLIYVDFNCYKRTGGLAEELEALNVDSILIDHHPYPDEIANLMISFPEASSTCELACNVIKQAAWMGYVTKDAAECFYSGIMTDTGSLSYNSSNPETYRIVAELLKIGIDKDKVHRLLFHSNSYNRMRLLGYILSEKMILMPDIESAYLWLTIEELERYGYEPGDTEGFVNYPLGIDGINISAFFIEKEDKVKCSFRSRGEFPVNSFSEKFFNGGGHRNAAGGESKADMESTVEKFKHEFPLFYQEYYKNK